MSRITLPIPLLPASIRWTAVFVVAGLIFYASLVTVPETVVDETHPGIIPLSSWRHFVAYFVLACTVAYAIEPWDIPRWHKAISVVAVVSVYGAGLEAGQMFVPHRTDFLIEDVITNTFGATGVLLWYGLHPRFHVQPYDELIE